MAENLDSDALGGGTQIVYAANNAITRALIARIRELERAQHAGEARERVAWGKYRYDMPQPAAVPFGWVSPTQGNYFTRNKTIANRIGGLMPVYAAPQPAALPEGWEWMDVIREKIQHFRNCCEDFEADGCDMSREWFDALTTIGLLRRVQRSPAIWEMTEAAEAMLAAAPQPREWDASATTTAGEPD